MYIKIKYILMLLMIMQINLINAQSESLGIFKQGDCITLKQTCANCTFNNVTSVIYPNSSQALGQISMTKIGTEYNYTFCDTNPLGTYVVNGKGDIDGINEIWAYDFDITGTGFNSSSSGNTGIYFILVIAGLFFAGFLFIKQDIYKWSFFLMFLFFVMIGVNMVSISIYNEIGNTQLGSIFDTLSAFSIYFYWFIGGLLLIIWVLTVLANIADRKNMKLAEQTGALTNFKYT